MMITIWSDLVHKTTSILCCQIVFSGKQGFLEQHFQYFVRQINFKDFI